MKIRYGNRSEEELQQAAAKERLFDLKSVLIGVGVFVLMLTVASLWRLSVKQGVLKRLKQFEFTPEAPDTEEFELKDPQRELLNEQLMDQPEELREFEETPQILMTPEPTDATIPEEVVKTDNIEITTDLDVSVTEMDIIDAPEEIVDLTEEVDYAVTPIASVVAAPADLFKFKEPNPRYRPQRALINRAPQASKGLKMTPRQFGDQDAPTIGEIGPVGINLLGSGEYLGALGRAGSLETRAAVDAALRWLALHQEPEGFWQPHAWDEEEVTFDEAAAGGDGGGRGSGHTLGISGLGVLGLMGGGHTIRKGEYRTHLLRGLEWIMDKQDRRTGRLSNNMYEQAICTIALCEASGRAPDERISTAARKAVDFCVQAVGADDGWRYQPNATESDMSVTGWFMQALKTAKLANIKFDHALFSRGQTFVDQLTDKGGASRTTGAVGYQYKPDLEYPAGGHPALTAAAMMIRQFSGTGINSPVLQGGAELLRQREPAWDDGKDFYLWYYATYAMHNMGGEHRLWWNRRIRDVLLDNQSKYGHQTGSWNPEDDKWNAGRVYCTALGALCLEVYYRYGEALQSFGIAPDFEDLFFQ